MSLELFLTFTVFAFVSGITPGPNNMMLLASGLNYGLKRSMPHYLGIIFGFAFLILMAGFGLLSVLDTFPLLYRILQVSALTYLLYLAWKIATASPIADADVSKKAPIPFLQAFAFQWVNPKAWVMVTAAITTYIPASTNEHYVMYLVAMAVYYSLITALCTGAWMISGHAFRHLLSQPLYYRIFNVTMAILLVLSLYPIVGEMKVWF